MMCVEEYAYKQNLMANISFPSCYTTTWLPTAYVTKAISSLVDYVYQYKLWLYIIYVCNALKQSQLPPTHVL